ncbi:hypothetical protein D3C75_1201950 [compost metagenome]
MDNEIVRLDLRAVCVDYVIQRFETVAAAEVRNVREVKRSVYRKSKAPPGCRRYDIR